MEMIYTAIILFSLAAMLGIYMLTLILRDKRTPKGGVVLHGLFAVAGLVLTIIYCFVQSPGPVPAVIAFVVAALGGVVLVVKDASGGPIPKWLAIVHGVVAVVGYVLLLIFAIA